MTRKRRNVRNIKIKITLFLIICKSCLSCVLFDENTVDEELVRKFHFGGDFNDGHADQSERVNTYE